METKDGTIVVTRAKLYPSVARPGPGWRWTYDYTVDGGPVCQYGTGLASLRDMLRRYFKGATVVYTWETSKPVTGMYAPGGTMPRKSLHNDHL